MREHELKVHDCYWDAINSGEKTFEVCRDDRGFQKSDVINLVRMINSPHTDQWQEDKIYSSNSRKVIKRKISYILTGGQFGIEPGYVVLGLKK